MRNHIIPSQYVPERDYDNKDLVMRTDTPIIRRNLPKDKNRKSTFTLTMLDSHPGLKRPVSTIMGASNTTGRLATCATVNYSAMAAHRRPFVKYVIQEVDVI